MSNNAKVINPCKVITGNSNRMRRSEEAWHLSSQVLTLTGCLTESFFYRVGISALSRSKHRARFHALYNVQGSIY